MHSLPASRLFLLLCCLSLVILPAVMSAPDSTGVSYSLVHISDTQNLAAQHPETYNLTFSILESRKEAYNISAVIITGDVVRHGESPEEWGAFSRARNLTTIPVFVIVGNHDTGGDDPYRFYTANTGMPNRNYLALLGDVDLIGINYVEQTLPADEFQRLRRMLNASPRSFTIIATHYYMDEDGTLSPLGEDIDASLLVRPSLILGGHVHGNLLKTETIEGVPVVADLTNYQDGIPGGSTGQNYSAGILYTLNSSGGRVEKITARVITFSPVQALGKEKTVYPGIAGEEGHGAAIFLSGPESPCTSGDVFCSLRELIQTLRPGMYRILS